MLLKTNIIAFQTIVSKEITRFTRIWVQTLLPPAITMTLYFIIFGNLIGNRIGTMGGFTYVQYIVPGLIMLSVTNNAYVNVVSSFFSARFQRSIEELLISPTSPLTILLGYIAGGTLRGLLTGCIVLGISLFFTRLHIHHLWLTLLTVTLCAILFSLAGFTNALFARKFDDISIVPTFILTPLTYLGGVFYSLTLLPDFWQTISLFNPILHMVNAFRYGMLGASDVPLSLALIIIGSCITCFFAVNLYLLHRGIGLRT